MLKHPPPGRMTAAQGLRYALKLDVSPNSIRIHMCVYNMCRVAVYRSRGLIAVRAAHAGLMAPDFGIVPIRQTECERRQSAHRFAMPISVRLDASAMRVMSLCTVVYRGSLRTPRAVPRGTRTVHIVLPHSSI